jgi:hypothetical protein
MFKEKEREALNRIIKILQENEGAADILGIKIENLITLRDSEPQLPRHTPLQKTDEITCIPYPMQPLTPNIN